MKTKKLLIPSYKAILLFGIIAHFLVNQSAFAVPLEDRDEHSLLEAQFLNVTEELKRSEFKDDTINYNQDDLTNGYNYKINTDFGHARSYWTHLKEGKEISSDLKNHDYADVKLSFEFPFFGRMVSELTVTTAGAVLLGPKQAEVHMPSHIAPFLSALPPGNDDIEYYDFGKNFTAQWTKHYLQDDHFKQEIQLTIEPDGVITFLFHNFIPPLVTLARNSGYPIIIGVQDSFAVPRPKPEKETDVYLYQSVHIDASKLTSNWSLVQMNPQFIRCDQLDEADDCDRMPRCIWCQGSSKCVYQMEIYRPENDCDRENRAEEVRPECDNDCDLAHDPVCGSDGITYNNKCSLEAIACMTKMDITVEAEGNCTAIDLDQNRKMREKCGLACEAIYQPLCGDNGITYPNECSLKMRNCWTGETTEKAKDGKCDDMDSYDYDNHEAEDGEEEYDEKDEIVSGGSPTNNEDCLKPCDKMMDPVCLNGNQVFSNKCVMDVIVCQENITVEMWAQGPCLKTEKEAEVEKGCYHKTCPKEINKPICASNDKTYENECLFDQIVCVHDLNIYKVRDGPCEEGCPPPMCTKELRPVCGSDKKTYSNKCLLEAAQACTRGLELAYIGPCEDEDIFGRQLAKDISADESTDQHGERRGALKGAVFLLTVVGLGLMGYAMMRVYRKSRRSLPPSYPVYTTTSANEPYDPDLSQANRPSTGTPIVTSNNAAGVELGIMGPGAPTSSTTATGAPSLPKYDRLPLVPNID